MIKIKIKFRKEKRKRKGIDKKILISYLFIKYLTYSHKYIQTLLVKDTEVIK